MKPVRLAQLVEALTSRARIDPSAANRSATPAPAETDHRVLTVLVAEDNPVNQKVVVKMLTRLGHRTDVASTGREAVDAWSRKPYDLVLMDCQMPDLDGLEATAQIRQRESGRRHTPIIALTANASTADRERCLAAGMDGFLAKPLKLETLADALTAWKTVQNGATPLERRSA